MKTIYRNAVLNQSACVFALGDFLKYNTHNSQQTLCVRLNQVVPKCQITNKVNIDQRDKAQTSISRKKNTQAN